MKRKQQLKPLQTLQNIGRICLFMLITPLSIKAQISVTPTFPTVDDNITLTYNATQGNAALSGVSPVYVHTGVITPASTSSSDWKNVKYPWTTNAADNVLTETPVGSNVHTIAYNIRNYYGIPMGTTVNKLAMVFRNATGSAVGKTADNADIFYDIWDGTSFQSKIVTPSVSTMTVGIGATINVQGATSKTGNLRLLIDGTTV